jgi:hypothetical protein
MVQTFWAVRQARFGEFAKIDYSRWWISPKRMAVTIEMVQDGIII